MSTKYQAQIKVNAEGAPGHLQRETVTLRATAREDSLTNRVVTGPAPSLSQMEYPLSRLHEARNGGAPRVGRGRDVAYKAAKRFFDFVVGSILLVIATPIILLAAVAIRFETKGSPFFLQTRLGKAGKPFTIVKLRGMFIDARTRFASYYDYSRHKDLEFCFHHEDDPRVTRAGKFIRKTSIDELPNLWNVVTGDMSLVGPRPEIPEVIELYGPYREEYLSVKPGVTCQSKCTGRDRLTKKETIEFDLGYVRNRSFKLDLQILWKTFRGVVLRRDVF